MLTKFQVMVDNPLINFYNVVQRNQPDSSGRNNERMRLQDPFCSCKRTLSYGNDSKLPVWIIDQTDDHHRPLHCSNLHHWPPLPPHPGQPGAHIADHVRALSGSLRTGDKAGNHQLPALPAFRRCRPSGLFRLFRRTGKADRPNWRLSGGLYLPCIYLRLFH